MGQHRMSNYYQLLGVDPTASVEDIKKAFRKRAFESHPDTCAPLPNIVTSKLIIILALDLFSPRIPPLPPGSRIGARASELASQQGWTLLLIRRADPRHPSHFTRRSAAEAEAGHKEFTLITEAYEVRQCFAK